MAGRCVRECVRVQPMIHDEFDRRRPFRCTRPRPIDITKCAQPQFVTRVRAEYDQVFNAQGPEAH